MYDNFQYLGYNLQYVYPETVLNMVVRHIEV